MTFHQQQCSNGLTIIGEVIPEARSAAVGFFVRTGSRDETVEESGVSHFLEHMLFKGTKKRDAAQVNKDFDKIGANYNAFTSEENTVFYASTLPEYHLDATEILADILRPSLRSADFEMEKKVIIEEIGMYEDNPGWMVFDHARKLFFADHPLGNSVLGTTQSITDLKRDQMLDYFQRRYIASNITLVASGNFEWDKFLKKAEKLTTNWKFGMARRDHIRQTSGSAEFKLLEKKTTTQQNVVMICPGPPAASPLRYAANLFAMILGDQSGSRLYWSLVDSGLAESADCSFHEYDGAGAFYTSFSCDPKQTHKNLEIVIKQIHELITKGITEEELEQAKSKVLSRIVRAGEKTMNRLQEVGMTWVYLRKYKSVDEDMQTYEKVNLRQMQQLIERYPLLRLTTTAMGPLAKLKMPEIPKQPKVPNAQHS
ncbi:MAG: insulinase family protein [Planctomycetota bacterium]|nr:MAG: insulinase family protein [Planctomycetota bacterium]